MASPISENRISSLTSDNKIGFTANDAMVGEPNDPSLVINKVSSFDSSTSETREHFPSDSSSSMSRTEMLSLPPTTGMIPSSHPHSPLRCFTSAHVFASTKDELRNDLKSLQVQLQESNAQRIKLEQELVEAKQIACITRRHFQESLRQYHELKTELEIMQTSEESQREGSQVAILHEQRTVLAQRVLQLLAQNGKLQATSTKVQHRMERQESHIEQLEQELYQLRNSDVVLMAQNSTTTTTTTSRSSWKGRSSPAPKPGSKPFLPAMDTPSCHQASSLDQRIQDLENQNRLLLDQQEQSKQHWVQERDQMQQYISVLQQKVVQLENAESESNSPHKRDFPPYTISCEDAGDDTPDKDQLSFMTNSTCSVTHVSRSSLNSPSAYLALQGRLQQIETELQEKQAIQDALTRQVEELRQVALEEKQRATSAQERVQSLRAYLNASWSKPRDQQHQHPEFSTIPTMMRGMSDIDPTKTCTVDEELTVSTPPDNSSLAPSEVEILTNETKSTGSDALDDLQQRVRVLEEKKRALKSKNAQLRRRLEQKTQENADLEDRVAKLKSNNGDGAETIFALLRQLEWSTEMDSHEKSLRQHVDRVTTERDDLANRLDATLQQVDHLATEKDNLEKGLMEMRKHVDRLTTERDNLTYRLRATERQLANVQDRVAELNDLNERLNKMVQTSSTGSDLQDKVDAQEKELSEYKSRYDQLQQESVQKEAMAKELHDQNEMLIAEIAQLSRRSTDLAADLDLAKTEIEHLYQNLAEKSEERHAFNATGELQTKNRGTASENEGSQEQHALLVKIEEFDALETSLKEANDQRREAEDALANMRLDVEIAKAKIEELSTGRATAHVEVSTNPTCIDSRLHIYDLEKENQSLSRRCRENENRWKEALMQCNQHEQMLEIVTVQVQELQAQITALEEAKRELTHQSETQLQAIYDVLDQRIKVLESEIVSLETERDGLKAQVESQRVSLESTTSKLHQTEGALQACREQLENRKFQGKVDECQDQEPYVEAASIVSGNEVSDVKLSASKDDQRDLLVGCKNTAPSHGKRTFKEIFSFGGLTASF